MKRQAKALLSVILVLTLISSVLAGFHLRARAATSGTSGSLSWSLSYSGVFTVSGTGYGDNYTATTVPWKDSRSSIKKVIVEDGVQAIGDFWFYNCTVVDTVTLPDSLVKIGASCFRGCTSLPCVTVPEECCEYYNNTFYGCTSLKWAVLPRDNSTTNYLHKIPDNTFNGCTALENVWVGADHTMVGGSAFKNCNSLTALVWTGDTVTSVGSYFPSAAIFVGSSAVGTWCSGNSKNFINISGACGDALQYSYDLNNKKLTLSGSGSMQSAPWNAWRYFICAVDLGNAASVCDNAFNGCEALTEQCAIPASVSAIGSNAFSGTAVTRYMIYGSAVSIADSAFEGREDLVFFGKRGSGVYDFVLGRRSGHADWRCYCLGSHFFNSEGHCVYCDKTETAQIVEPLGDHQYVYRFRVDGNLYYTCDHCGADKVCVSASDLLLDFDSALTTESTPYEQSNYDGRFDVLRDGYVNAKDLKLLQDIRDGKPTDVDMNLTNENATPQAQALFRYIVSVYGNHIISGQQESTWMNGGADYEVNYIKKKTGKYPAIRGFDFMNEDFSGVVSRARSWADKGGIVTICWHCSSSFDAGYNECKADTLTNAQWEAVLTDGTAEHAAFMQGMDKAGNALLQLQNSGIPVLWRPFHEFDGAWFWWGKGGNERFKQLWHMMYDHFTYDLGLNNLIWVLGYSHNGTGCTGWYPGTRYCDIAGADTYEVAQNGAEARLFAPVNNAVSKGKPLVMHETGLIPTVEQFQEVPWAYFMTWHTTYLTEENTVTHLNEIYNSDYVITLDELEDFYHG